MKIIKSGQASRDALKKGIDLVCDAVKVTIGPNGRNAVLGRVDIPPTITNDGVSIARNIEAEDETENLGCWIAKEACSVASNKAGDGTTTTAVLLQAIIGKLFDEMKDNGSIVSKKPNVIELMNQVDKACADVCEYLKTNSRIITDEEIFNVAKVAGEFDWIAQMVSEIFKKIGKDGYITVQEGLKSKYDIFKGIELKSGYHSEYYINNDNRECVLETPTIFVTNQALDSFIVAPLTTIIEKGKKDIIIIAPEFSRDLLNRLTTTKVKGGLNIVALKLPTFDKDDLLIDVATLTKAKFLDKNTYTKIDAFITDFNIESAGSAERAVIDDSNTVLIGGEGDCTERVAKLKSTLENTQSVFDRDNLEKRIAYLSGGIATLTIGGESDFEKGYFKLKADNAVASAQQALKEGVVKGGGLALKEASETLPVNILTECLKAPYNQIQANAGGKLDIPDTVIDPIVITTSALKSACSLAGRVVTIETSTAFKNKKDES